MKNVLGFVGFTQPLSYILFLLSHSPLKMKKLACRPWFASCFKEHRLVICKEKSPTSTSFILFKTVKLSNIKYVE